MPNAATSEFPLTWDLESLAPNPASDDFKKLFTNLEAQFRELISTASSLKAVNETFGSGGNQEAQDCWKQFLLDYEAASQTVSDINSVIGCYAADDAENVLYQQWEAKLSGLGPLQAEIGTTVEFLLKDSTDENFTALQCVSEEFANRSFFLTELRDNAKFRMPQEQEVLASQLDVHGLHAWSRLYDQISGSLRIPVMEKGEIVEKSPGQVMYDSNERSVRENEFFASHAAWEKVAPTCAVALNQISGSRLVRYENLGVEDHLSLPLHMNRMKRSTLDAMWGAIAKRKNKLAGYLETRAKFMGVEKISWFDLYAPLPIADAGESKISYDDACHQILDAFAGFSDDLKDFSETALRERWVEAENRSGKRQGGFCTGIPGHSQSRIFMTYTDTVDSLSTLAHELGHAYHSWVLRDQPFFHQDYPMNLAETASTFAETVVGQVILSQTDDINGRLQILDKMLQDSTAFMMNIHCRFLFEDRFHKLRQENELSADELSNLMVEAQKEAYVGQLADDGLNSTFWISKLHFYISGYPFYNFPYTFGYLLSQGIYKLGSEYGDEFPRRYCDFLTATGSMSAEDAVSSSFGKDITQESFWESCIDIIDERIDEFQDLASQKLG